MSPDFSQIPLDVLVGVAVVIVIGGIVIGQIMDLVMGDRGFGPFGNGFLAILGASVGLYARLGFFEQPGAADLMTSALVAAATSTGLLLLVAVVKSLILRS